MSLRCVYTDLDGTLLGAGASLFTDEEGNFSMMQARASVDHGAGSAGRAVHAASGSNRVIAPAMAADLGPRSCW